MSDKLRSGKLSKRRTHCGMLSQASTNSSINSWKASLGMVIMWKSKLQPGVEFFFFCLSIICWFFAKNGLAMQNFWSTPVFYMWICIITQDAGRNSELIFMKHSELIWVHPRRNHTIFGRNLLDETNYRESKYAPKTEFWLHFSKNTAF